MLYRETEHWNRWKGRNGCSCKQNDCGMEWNICQKRGTLFKNNIAIYSIINWYIAIGTNNSSTNINVTVAKLLLFYVSLLSSFLLFLSLSLSISLALSPLLNRKHCPFFHLRHGSCKSYKASWKCTMGHAMARVVPFARTRKDNAGTFCGNEWG